MSLLSGHSRRALIGATAALAAAPVAEAKKKGKKKKKPAPLVLAMYTVFDVNLQGDENVELLAEGVYEHLPTGQRFGVGGPISMPFPGPGDDLRAQLVATLQETISGFLAIDGIDGVPADRIAVTLL